MAVTGAVLIARKQIGITARQVEISARQASIQASQLQLQQLSLKIAIFERRMKVFETAMRYISKTQSASAKVSDDETKDFYIAVAEARFLFTAPVYDKLQEWSRKCAALNDARKEAAQGAAAEAAKEQKIAELTSWMDEQSGNFIDIFRDEITV